MPRTPATAPNLIQDTFAGYLPRRAKYITSKDTPANNARTPAHEVAMATIAVLIADKLRAVTPVVSLMVTETKAHAGMVKVAAVATDTAHKRAKRANNLRNLFITPPIV